MQELKGIFFRDIENDHLFEIIKEMYHDRVYDPFLKDKKDLTIIDLGANIGLFTYYAYDKAKVIYSVEPSAQHFETLTSMLTFNHFDKAIPIKCAVSNVDGTQTFYHNTNSTMFSLKPEVNGLPGEAEEVRTVTLETLFKENNIEYADFIKMDVEGVENLIVGSSSFDRVADKIGTILGEFHTWSGINPKQFETAFLDRGFDFTWLNRTEASIFSAIRKE